MKNKSYIVVSFVILVFGILFVPKIVNRIQNGDVIRGQRLDQVNANGAAESDLVVIGKSPEFTLIDQDGNESGSEFFKGKVHVLEFFFVSCPTICPKMNGHMLQIEKKFFGNPNFGIASITIDTQHDTPEVLKKHAEDLGVQSQNWRFFTGEQKQVMELSEKGFNLYAGQRSDVPGGFEHSGFFALIDKEGNIRSRIDEMGNPVVYYDGTEKEGVEAIMQDIAKLLKE